MHIITVLCALFNQNSSFHYMSKTVLLCYIPYKK